MFDTPFKAIDGDEHECALHTLPLGKALQQVESIVNYFERDNTAAVAHVTAIVTGAAAQFQVPVTDAVIVQVHQLFFGPRAVQELQAAGWHGLYCVLASLEHGGCVNQIPRNEVMRLTSYVAKDKKKFKGVAFEFKRALDQRQDDLVMRSMDREQARQHMLCEYHKRSERFAFIR